MSTMTNNIRAEQRRDDHQSVNMDVVEFGTDAPADKPARIVSSFLVEQTSLNDWIYFTDQDGNPMPLPDSDETAIKQGGFVWANKRGGYYHKNDGTYSPDALSKTAAHFVSAAPVVTGERPIVFSAGDYEIILAIESAMIEEIDMMTSGDDGNSEGHALDHCASIHLFSQLGDDHFKQVNITFTVPPSDDMKAALLAGGGRMGGGDRAWYFPYVHGWHNLNPVVSAPQNVKPAGSAPYTDLADHCAKPQAMGSVFGSVGFERKPTQKPTKDSMGMDCLPTFGKVAKVNPTAPEPASVLTLAIQDPRAESEKEESRMKAAESMTLPMFAECGEESPIPPAVVDAFMQAETLQEALATPYLDLAYDDHESPFQADLRAFAKGEAFPVEAIPRESSGPNCAAFLEFFEPVDRTVGAKMLMAKCDRCHKRLAGDNPSKWCDHCWTPKGNGEGRVGDYYGRFELADLGKRYAEWSRTHCDLCKCEVPESRRAPKAKRVKDQKSALCEQCEVKILKGEQ